MALRLRKIGLALLGLAVAGYMVYPALTPEVAKAKSNRIPVRFWHMWTAEWKDVVDGIAAEFNSSQHKYEVIPLSVPSSGADYKFLLSVVGGDPPDVMAQWNPVIPTWAESNLLTPLDDLMSPEEKHTFDTETYPIARRFGTYKGKVYGITIGLNMYAFYYNPEHFREVGRDPKDFPKTLEDLVALAKKLDRFGKQKNLTRLGVGMPGIQMIAPAFGGGFYDWETGKVTIDTPGNLKALEFITAERKRLGFDNVTRFNSGLDTQSMKGGWPFVAGAYSVTLDGQWKVEEVRKNIKGFEYLSAPMPPPKGGIPNAGNVNGNFMIIPASAKEKQGAWEFVKFWSGLENPERAAHNYVKGGWLPLSPAIANSPDYQKYLRENPQFKTFVDLMSSTSLTCLPPVPYQVLLNDQIGRAEDAALRGTLTPKEALQKMESEVNKELARRKEFGYRD
jgi:multiple sugar transport system substrate-binding protein